MPLKRLIPCLDVDDGRVVKGTNFVDIRDAGDPVELAARYDAEGADELDLPRHHRLPRGSRHDRPARPAHRRRGLHPVHDRRRHPLGRRRPGGPRRRRRQGRRQLRRARPPGADRRARRGLRLAVRRRRDRRPPRTRRRIRARLGRLRRRRPQPGRGTRGGRLGRRGRRARSRGDPAHEHGPRRDRGRLRPRADPRGRRRGPDSRDRLRRRRHPRPPRGRDHSRAAPTPSSPPRSSTTAATRSPRRSGRCGRPASTSGRAQPLVLSLPCLGLEPFPGLPVVEVVSPVGCVESPSLGGAPPPWACWARLRAACLAFRCWCGGTMPFWPLLVLYLKLPRSIGSKATTVTPPVR